MNWILQTQGTINLYDKNIHKGTQPIRIIHHMLIYMFQRTHPDFFKDLMKQIEEGKLHNELSLVFEKEPILISNGQFRTPKINNHTRKIELHETFLSFLWCSIYSVYVTYLETIDYPRVNRENGEILHPRNQSNIDKAKELFDYAKYLIVDFKDWNKESLPNPEIYFAEKRDNVEQTNCFYTEAVKFILCHEFTHLKYHVDQIDNQTANSYFLAFEIEADNNAIDMMKRGMEQEKDPFTISHKLAIEIGIVFGLLSMFYFRANTSGLKHPNAEDRLTNALERLELVYNHFAWGIACVGLQMWDEQFGLKFNWCENPISYKGQYYDIIIQIKQRTK